MVASTNQLAGEYVKSHSGKVKDVMTRDVVSVTEETPVADIAVLLETNTIKRVPVLRGGTLAGIVSRANLVRALAMTITAPVGGPELDDRAIRVKLLEGKREPPLVEREVAPMTDGLRAHALGEYVVTAASRAELAARMPPAIL